MTAADRVSWPRLAAVVVLCAALLTPGHLATPDAHLRLAQARNLVTDGSLAVPNGVGNPDHGNLAPGSGDEVYSVYNPGHILLLTPVYALASELPTPFDLHPHYSAAFGASFLGALAHFFTSLVLLALLLRLGRSVRTSLLVAALFAFATISLPNATDGYDHTFEALAIVGSLFFLIEDDGEAESAQPALAGLVLGAGVLFRYTVLLALPGLVWAAGKRRSRIRFLLGLTPAVVATLLYNHHRFGAFFETGYRAAWQLAHGSEIGETGFQISKVPGNLFGLLASPGKGLFWFSPVIAAAIPGWAQFRRSRTRVADAIAATAVLYLLFYAANFAWHGSVWSWGPRYLVPITAPVLVGIAFLPNDRRYRNALIVLGLASVLVQAAAVTADHRRYLLEEYTRERSGFERRILYEPSSSPVIGQFDSSAHVLKATVGGGDFHPFIGPGPWRSVARPAPSDMMLEQSIDFNVVDLWWIRFPFFASSAPATVIALAFGGLGTLVTVWMARSEWRATSAA